MAEGDNRQGLAYLLSLEKFPRPPALRSPSIVTELERWIRDLEHYLRRLFGLFTADNINITIINEGGGTGFEDKLVKIEPGVTGTQVLINTDCRGKFLQWWVCHPFTSTDPVTSEWSTWANYGVFHFGTGWTSGADVTMINASTTAGTLFAIDIDKSTGKIKLMIDSTGVLATDYIRIGALVSPVIKSAPDLVFT